MGRVAAGRGVVPVRVVAVAAAGPVLAAAAGGVLFVVVVVLCATQMNIHALTSWHCLYMEQLIKTKQ